MLDLKNRTELAQKRSPKKRPIEPVHYADSTEVVNHNDLLVFESTALVAPDPEPLQFVTQTKDPAEAESPEAEGLMQFATELELETEEDSLERLVASDEIDEFMAGLLNRR
jgi:hypothetical protein